MQQIRRSGRSRTRVAGAIAAVAVALIAAGCGSSEKGDNGKRRTSTSTASAPAPSNGKAIKIGVLTTCGGPFALFEQESLSGAKYALIKYAGGKAAGTGPQDQVNNATVAGKPVQIAFGCSDATPDKAVAEARR